MTRAHILIVEDERIVAKDIERSLVALGYIICGIVSTGSKAIAKTGETRPDLVLMDIKLKDTMDGIAAAEEIRTAFDIPVVYLTAYADDKTLERAKVTGPFGYILKPFNERELCSTIEMALYKHQMDKDLKESEGRYRKLVEQSPDLIMIHSSGVIDFINTAGAKLLGASDPAYIVGKPLVDFVHPDCKALVMGREKEVMEESKRVPLTEEKYVRFDGQTITVEVEALPVVHKNRPAIQCVARDVTDRKRLEAQLLHAQKMEAVGTLANTIAHDFNNILTAIIGYGSFLQMKMEDDSSLRHYVDQILVSCDKATNLTQGLLSFSRKKVIQTKMVNLNDIINRIEKLLDRLVREETELKIACSDRDLVIMADSGQMEQVLMNLVTNAKDAIPEAGRIAIRTDYVRLDAEFERVHGYGKPGDYARISVSDTGSGMEREIVDKIFEPFFTTKEVGKGTGLGLAIVYGIVRQHNGYINVYSEPGKGTVFNIYLPLIASKAENEGVVVHEEPVGGSETILLAEDDEIALDLIKEILEKYGYRVITAMDGDDALHIFQERAVDIDLAIFDVIMPKKSGTVIYEEMLRTNPRLKVLFMSGYTPEIIGERGFFGQNVNFIQKPIMPYPFVRKVREVLDREQS
jgi:two-component system cell cycle sensor histidine kinase/response regulator CckA